ncbi:MAG: GC-type dockerin domain-anchored protein [Planctomycetota bacterium]|nr:GC-type dockerin domain-anchored protein [Planctomycetota bacterium]
MSIRVRSSVVASASCVLLSGAVPALAVPTVVYSTIASSPTSDVPGGGGLKFISFDRPNPSQDGTRWIGVASVDSGSTTTDTVLLVGASSTAVVAIREGVTPIEGTRVAGSLTADRRASITNAGTWAYSVDLDGATTDDRAILTGSGASFSIAFREGNLIDAIAGTSFGSTIAEAHIEDDGQVSVRAGSIAGAASTNNAALLGDNGQTLLARSGTTTPAGQLVLPEQTYSSFDFNTFSASADESAWAVRASLTGPGASNSVVVRNNTVVAQEGASLAGLSNPIQQFYGRPILGGDNNAYYAGWTTQVASEFFAARNSTVLAKAGQPIVTGSTEVWDTTSWNVTNGRGFFVYHGDASGNYVLGGFTSSTADRNVVYVLNGQTVLLRAGDGVDLNGDGLLNDDAFFYMPATATTGASLGNKVEDGWLSSDGFFYEVVDLRDGVGNDLGDALIRVPLPGVNCAADFNSDGQADFFDYLDFVSAFSNEDPAADINEDGQVDFFDYLDFATAFDAGCP